MRFWINLLAHLCAAVLASRVLWLGIFYQQEKGFYIFDAYSIVLTSILAFIHFWRWIDLGRQVVEIDAKSVLKIRKACSELGVQMYREFWYFIKPMPNAALLDAAAHEAFKKNMTIGDNFDLYRVIFLTPGFVGAIFISLFIFIEGIFLGPSLFAKGAWRPFSPLTPFVVLICWGLVVHLVGWVFLYLFTLIQGRK